MNKKLSVLFFKIIEPSELEGALKGYPVQLPCSDWGQLQVDQVAQSAILLDLECLQGQGPSITTLGKLLQYLTTLTVIKNLFLVSNLYLLSFSLKLFPVILSQ